MARAVHGQGGVTNRDGHFALAVLELLPLSLVVVDRSAAVVHATRRALRLLDERDALQVVDGRLHGVRSDSTASLQRTIARVVASRREQDGGIVRLARRSHPTPLAAFVTPLEPAAGSRGRPARDGAAGGRYDAAPGRTAGPDAQPPPAGNVLAAVCIADPDHPVELNQAALRDLYKLTPAEIGLASLLANGLTLDEAAEVLDVRRNTVRTHLRQLFGKTGTGRQAELVRLLLTGVGQIRFR